jgi:hypothetical protein
MFTCQLSGFLCLNYCTRSYVVILLESILIHCHIPDESQRFLCQLRGIRSTVWYIDVGVMCIVAVHNQTPFYPDIILSYNKHVDLQMKRTQS